MASSWTHWVLPYRCKGKGNGPLGSQGKTRSVPQFPQRRILLGNPCFEGWFKGKAKRETTHFGGWVRFPFCDTPKCRPFLGQFAQVRCWLRKLNIRNLELVGSFLFGRETFHHRNSPVLLFFFCWIQTPKLVRFSSEETCASVHRVLPRLEGCPCQLVTREPL